MRAGLLALAGAAGTGPTGHRAGLRCLPGTHAEPGALGGWYRASAGAHALMADAAAAGGWFGPLALAAPLDPGGGLRGLCKLAGSFGHQCHDRSSTASNHPVVRTATGRHRRGA